jgi:hypothetical protein
VNENQGAESTLSFLLALTEMRAAERALASLARPLRSASQPGEELRAAAPEVAS